MIDWQYIPRLCYFNKLDLREARLGIQGLGKVGLNLLQLASEHGIKLVAGSTQHGALYSPEGLDVINSETVREAWHTALSRRDDDPDGAITASRSLLETVCKHILDESGVSYDPQATLPDLFRLTSNTLNLHPSQYVNHILKRTLGGIVTTVEGIGSLRNVLGDAHGRGAQGETPDTRHAELAVTISGAISTFLISCWESNSG